MGEPLNIEFLGEVSQRKREEIRYIVDDVRGFFDYMASGKPDPVSIIVSHDQDLLKKRWREITGYEYSGKICGVRESSLFVLLEESCGEPGVFAHELVHHYLQEARAPGALTPDYGPGYSNHGPWWLTEGAAEYGSTVYEVSRGLADYDRLLRWRINEALRSTRSLAEMETKTYFEEDVWAAYSLGYLAVEKLVELSSEEALLRYNELLLHYHTWHEAFEDAFGVSVDEFYESFEEHRSTILPTTYRIAGRVLGPAGEPLQGIGIWAWQSDRDNSRFGRTALDGAFNISILDGSFTLAIYGAGSCFLGWYDGRSITAGYDPALRIKIDGESVGGIEIKLPAHPDDLPCL